MAGAAAWMWGLRRIASGGRAPAPPVRPTSSGAPRYWVFVLASGGWDAVLTLDPKTKKQVEPGIDVPYDAHEIVAGTLPLGPNFAPLKRWTNQLAILNTVQVSAANHEFCWLQWMRFRRAVDPSMPMMMQLLAQRRTQPLGAVSVGPGTPHDYGAGFFGTRAQYWGDPVKFKYTAYQNEERRFLDDLELMRPDELAVMARVLRKEQRELAALGGTRNRNAAEAAGEAAALFEAMPRFTMFEPEDWSKDQPWGPLAKGTHDVGRDFQRALWALQNDVAKVVYIRVGALEWDTHQSNLERQTTWNTVLAASLDRFIERLHGQRNEHGTLAEQTTVVVGSEVGRFPKLNPHDGKDHLPEVPHLLFGANINTGAQGALYGATDRRMLGMPVDLATGRPSKGGALVTLDDLGTTLLTLNGMRPDLYGYSGRFLRFLAA